MSAEPVLAVVAEPGESARVAPLVRHLARQVAVVAWHGTATRPDAVLATSNAALRRALDVWDGPTVVWLPHPDGAELLVGGPHQPDHGNPSERGDDATAAPLAGARARVQRIAVPDPLIDLPDWDPVHPTVRDRWRRRLDWPPLVVVPAGRGSGRIPSASRLADERAGGAPLVLVDRPEDPAERITLLALAGAAVVDGDDLADAVALATPVVCRDDVTDPALAEIVPTIPEVSAAIRAACALATSRQAAHRSAALTVYRRAHHLDALAHEVLVALGLRRAPRSPGDVALARLRETGLAPDSPLAARVRAAYDGLTDLAGGPEPADRPASPRGASIRAGAPT